MHAHTRAAPPPATTASLRAVTSFRHSVPNGGGWLAACAPSPPFYLHPQRARGMARYARHPGYATPLRLRGGARGSDGGRGGSLSIAATTRHRRPSRYARPQRSRPWLRHRLGVFIGSAAPSRQPKPFGGGLCPRPPCGRGWRLPHSPPRSPPHSKIKSIK